MTARSLDVRRLPGAGLLARFGTIGLIAFVVDITVFNLARHGLDLGPLTSKTVAAVVSISVAFLGNRSWTFRDRERGHTGASYLRFFAVNGLGLAIQLACLAISTYALGLHSPAAENISANGVGLVIATCFRLWAYHRWVFPTHDSLRTSLREGSTRPWGSWRVLDEDHGFKVKRITVQPHQRLSYQTHQHRAEHWFVVTGRATCVVDGDVALLTPGDSIDVAATQAHRIINDEDDVLEIIEIQRGAYTGEDDIVRLDDAYGRVAAPT